MEQKIIKFSNKEAKDVKITLMKNNGITSSTDSARKLPALAHLQFNIYRRMSNGNELGAQRLCPLCLVHFSKLL